MEAELKVKNKQATELKEALTAENSSTGYVDY